MRAISSLQRQAARPALSRQKSSSARALRLQPLMAAMAVGLMATGYASGVRAQHAFSPAWFAAKGNAQATATQTGRMPNGVAVSTLVSPQQQSQAARQQLQQSLANLNTAAQAVALQQSLQRQARAAGSQRAAVPDGLGEGGLEVDSNSLTAGWINANAPTQERDASGQVTVAIEQTADKAILNWETFNVGRNTTVEFKQEADWAVLNRINDPQARPSQVQGRIKAPGTVMVVNRNGIVFEGGSQVDVRNLTAAAVGMSDAQFNKGLYSDVRANSSVPSFGNDISSTATAVAFAPATGDVVVEAGASIRTHAPSSVTQGGGYVLLLGREVGNRGTIETPSGQTVLAAGDAFVIRKGMGTDSNTTSTTRGNEVTTLRAEGSQAGKVVNQGLVRATQGDITLVGHDVVQDGVLLSSTSVNTRGTVHLRAEGSDEAKVTLRSGAVAAVLLDESAATALDAQRDALVRGELSGVNSAFRRDQSLVHVQSAGDVLFEGSSLTLATGGQIAVQATRRAELASGARLDVSGAVGVNLTMESNNVAINVQGNEQRDAPINRDGDALRNATIWIDRRKLAFVAAGTQGYDKDRWYTGGGLLEVGGYLGTTSHGIGEWAAQGGTVDFSGGELITRSGSLINLAGGSLDVQTGRIRQTFLKGEDGHLYEASSAPGDLLYAGLYEGFVAEHARWGSNAREVYRSLFIAPASRLESGYTVGRDAGRLVIGTQKALLEGELDTTVFQGARQQHARNEALDGYQQLQTAAARRGQLIVGRLTPVFGDDAASLRHTPQAVADAVLLTREAAVEQAEAGIIQLQAAWLNAQKLGELQIYANGRVHVEDTLEVVPGGHIALHANEVEVDADLRARGGHIALGNGIERYTNSRWESGPLTSTVPEGYVDRVTVGDGVTLDVRGLWSNLQLDPSDASALPYLDGGRVDIVSTGDVRLGQGSVIDSSSGAAVRADGRIEGGRGGDVSISAGHFETGRVGTLVLGGEIRGHGVAGGGTLTLNTGIGMAIGGSDLADGGVLPAGQSAAIHLTLAEPVTLAAGTVLDTDFSYTSDVIPAGGAFQGVPNVSREKPLVLAADWTVPLTAQPWIRIVVQTADYNLYQAGQTIPAGAVIVGISGDGKIPEGYIVPRDAFPNGFPVATYTGVIKAGTPLPNDVHLAAGERLQAGTSLGFDVAVEPLVVLDPSLLRSGFSSYRLGGKQGLQLAQGASVDVVMPVLRVDADAARLTPTGADAGGVLQAWLPDLWQEDPAQAVLTQRAGASITLTGGDLDNRAPLVMGKGSSLRVDPGQSITLQGSSQITLDGELMARGGRISVLGEGLGGHSERNAASGVPDARSLWLGEQARLDASGIAATARGANGQIYGVVLDGGVIELGAPHDLDTTKADAIDAFLVLRPGSVLDASGTSALLDVPGQGARVVASDGGTLSLSSARGIYLDGQLLARAGGEGAAGGTLAMQLETPSYGPVAATTLKGLNVDDAVRLPREIVVSQNQRESGLSPALQVGWRDGSLVYGQAHLGVDTVQAGGFDHLALLANGLISFEGDVDLSLAQSLRLTASALSLARDTPLASHVRLAAPYVRLAGSTRHAEDRAIMPNPVKGSVLGVPLVAEGSSFTLDGALIDIVGANNFGVRGNILLNADAPLTVERLGFDQLTLRSSGDLRLSGAARLQTPGDLLLAASQIYPATGDTGVIVAGQSSRANQWGSMETVIDPTRSIRIERYGNAVTQVPYSVFGTLTLASGTIEQGGVLRAPLGTINLGQAATGYTGQVTLLPGSVTSVSALGLMLPYGGTIDGLTYTYNGIDVVLNGVGFEPKVAFGSHAVDVQPDALLDLRGGGELLGAGFLSGRGGSTDARLYPLMQTHAEGGFTLPGLVSNPVYAIVPGVQTPYAPIAAEKGAGDPAIGRQITLGEGVPGLAAGVYTLMPSSYALLPGAFRVELNGSGSMATTAGGVYAMRNGSWSTAARLSTAHTTQQDAWATPVILTPAAMLRRYSQYNETGLSAFAVALAQREGIPRAVLERDAKGLAFEFLSPSLYGAVENPSRTLRFEGVALDSPAEDGRGSTAVVRGSARYEILPAGAEATPGFEGISVHAPDLNAIGANRIVVGGVLQSAYTTTQGTHQSANIVNVNAGSSHTVVLRSGSQLEAAEVYLVSGRSDGGIVVEQGAGINTLGRGQAAYDSLDGYTLAPGAQSVLAVSNGWLDVLAPTLPAYDDGAGAGSIRIGACSAGVPCEGTTRLYSEGTITAATDKEFTLDDSARYGARNLVLAVGGINVGSQEQLAQAEARGGLPAGLVLNQQLLDRLLQGDTESGAPALENLVLTARDSVNFFGDTLLSTLDPATGKSSLRRLVLGTPAIYGLGGADDVARIQTDTLVWNGAATPPGQVVTQGAGTGSGRLQIDAREIELGFGPDMRVDNLHDQDRLALGFSEVALNASERVTANNRGTLAVYRSQGAWDDASKGRVHSGGRLVVTAPLLTGRAGSVQRWTAGGDIVVRAPADASAPRLDTHALAESIGAEITLDSLGGSLTLDTAVLLPSGKLVLAALGDVLLTDRSVLDLAGRKVDFFDVSKYGWGGDVSLESRTGSVMQAGGSVIDLSAVENRAGKLAVQASGSPDATAALHGRILGSASGHGDAGGTLVPYAAGRIELHAQRIDDFAGLNTRLTEGGVTGGRMFHLLQGDLVVGDEVRAREVDISVDRGHLTVEGRIDASGEGTGAIRLAGGHGLSLASGAVLDARATVLRVDSYGQPIEAPNRAVIELDSGDGRLTLAGGARLDLSVAGSPQAYGTVTLNAPRVGGARGNDVDIDASGAIGISGAKSITVNAFHTYRDARPGEDVTVDGRTYQVIDQDYLDRKHDDSRVFIDQALRNDALMNTRLAGLRTYGEQFHLRPGVEIVADTRPGINPDGDLHVDGDIDLSGHRYAGVNPRLQKTAVHGSGEAGALVLRAAGNLDIYGSISDGFDGSRLEVTPDDNGWILPKGRIPWGGDLVVPHGQRVTLADGTFFQSGRTLNYDLPMQAMSLDADTRLPATATLAAAVTLAAGTVLGGDVRDASGQLIHAAGTLLRESLTLPANSQLGAGMRVPTGIRIAAMIWPAGVALPYPQGRVVEIADSWSAVNGVQLAGDLTLRKGAMIPGETVVKLPGDAESVALRPLDDRGTQGRNWALAPMLAAGSASWDLRLVAGADTEAADSRLTVPHRTARIRLADTHFGLGSVLAPVPGTGEPGVLRWDADMDASFWEAMGLTGLFNPGEIVTAFELEMLQLMGYISESPLELNDWGGGPTLVVEKEEVPPEYAPQMRPTRQQLFSVLRTGTGDLDLVASGDVATSSPYGVYTAGTPSASLSSGSTGDPHNLARGRGLDAAAGTVLGTGGDYLEHLVDGGSDSLYQAWYPEHGGNLLVRAGGSVSGDLIGQRGNNSRMTDAFGVLRNAQSSSTAIGNWLWRQGTGDVVNAKEATPTAWWINFGTYVAGHEGVLGEYGDQPALVGFTGMGTLGGGNLVFETGGDAGNLAVRGDIDRTYVPRSQGLNLAVASTGRMTSAGELVLTGGGDLDIRIGGTLNPVLDVKSNQSSASTLSPQVSNQLDLNGTFVNLRGAMNLQAGSLGTIQLRYDQQDAQESRPYRVATASSTKASGGVVLVPGDSGVRMEARGDLVLGSVVDAGRVPLLYNGVPFTYDGVAHDGQGWTWFSLWTPSTALDLLSAGGNLTPGTAWTDQRIGLDHQATDGRYVYPSQLRAAALQGNVFYGNSISGTRDSSLAYTQSTRGIVLAPSPVASEFSHSRAPQLELLAADSIYGGGYAINLSGADPTALPTPHHAGFSGAATPTWYGWGHANSVPVDALMPSVVFGNGKGLGTAQVYPMFSLVTPSSSGYAAAGQQPSRYYAVAGDAIGVRTGSIVSQGSNPAQSTSAGNWYEGNGPVAIRAGRDIVDSGTALGQYGTEPVDGMGWTTFFSTAAHTLGQPPRIDIAIGGTSRGNLVMHNNPDDISVVSAGRDIRHGTFYVTGPGLLEVTAGRDLYLADKGELRSLGAVVNVRPGDRSSGASIVAAAGMGAQGGDYAAFAARYLDPANLADPNLPFADQPGRALAIYSGALTLSQWLAHEFGYTGDEAGAQAFMAGQQARLDQARQQAVAAGGTAANRSLEREYRTERSLHLVDWLSDRFGAGQRNGLGLQFDAATMDARDFFSKLPDAQQRAFLRNVYYAELRAAGREYNEAGGPRQGSYLRGREAIATLLPGHDAQGRPLDYSGDLTMFSSAQYYDQYVNGVMSRRPKPGVDYIRYDQWQALGSPSYYVPYYQVLDAGIHTDFGGDISLMVPGGRALVGVDGGFTPAEGSGLLTQGEGDINIYAKGSLLLGQSRIFTTFGGNILAWSAEGDINAGRGSKTSVVYTPQRRVYDEVGNVTLSPSTPNTGAGIATLNPIPEVLPGDVDLIAPLGTIDAGEAGIRVSGNVNLAAMQVVNAENIQVQGDAVGIPVVAAVNVGALSNASSAASAASAAAQEVVQRQREETRKAMPSVFTVRVLGFGQEPAATPVPAQPAGLQSGASSGSVRVLGEGRLDSAQMTALTARERAALAQ